MSVICSIHYYVFIPCIACDELVDEGLLLHLFISTIMLCSDFSMIEMDFTDEMSSPNQIARTTLDFPGEKEEQNWEIDPVSRQVKYSGEIIQTDFDATGRRLATTLSDTTLVLDLPFDFLWNAPWLPQVDAALEAPVVPAPPSPPVINPMRESALPGFTAGTSSSGTSLTAETSNGAAAPATSMEAHVPDVESPPLPTYTPSK